MKYSVAAIAVLASFVAAQDRSVIPSCAIECIDAGITAATDCALSDYACSCEAGNQSKITAEATLCVIEACGAAKAPEVLSGTAKFCASLPADGGSGGDDTPPAQDTSEPAPAPTKTPDETSAPAPAPTSAPVESSTPAPVSNGPVTVTVFVCDSSSVKVPTPTPVPTGNSTVPTTPPPAQFTGAASKLGAGLGSVAALALAAFAL